MQKSGLNLLPCSRTTLTSLFFLYIRAMEWWLAPGGRLGFYLPLALSEASNAEPLRAILARYRIVEIIDLEEIGNVAFHGANVVTIGLVMKRHRPQLKTKSKLRVWCRLPRRRAWSD